MTEQKQEENEKRSIDFNELMEFVKNTIDGVALVDDETWEEKLYLQGDNINDLYLEINKGTVSDIDYIRATNEFGIVKEVCAKIIMNSGKKYSLEIL